MKIPTHGVRVLARRALWLGVVMLVGSLSWPQSLGAAEPITETGSALQRTYAGSLTLQVDASDVDHRLMQVQESIPVKPGPLTLLYPKWLPGNHAPTGPIEALAGLRIVGRAAAGADAGSAQPIEWQRDPLDVYAFHLQVPAGVSELVLTFQFASPVSAEQGRRVMTPEMLGLQWEKTLLYPAGVTVTGITVLPSLIVPRGFAYASALELTQRDGDILRFRATSLDTLIDSPVFAGRNSTRVVLDDDATAPVYLNVFADRPAQLAMKPEQLDAHRRLVREARAAFGSRHYRHYDFLLALSDSFSGIGLEHHQSSEDGVEGGYFTDWDTNGAARDLLPHEMTHSWNGKFRRPADLWTPTYNVPMQNSLLWVYEGMTEFWGMVLAARSGLWSPQFTRDAIAWTGATYGEQRRGRNWRALQDTTNQPIMGYHKPTSYPSWQRGTDYYSEGMLLWLDVDMRLRSLTREQRSLDDFARRFVGIHDGELGPLTYTYADVLANLAAVAAADWNAVLRAHLDGDDDATATAGLNRSGWQLVFTDKPTDYLRSLEQSGKLLSLTFSLGLSVKKEGARISEVIWDSPAFRAGLAPAMIIIAVDGHAYSEELLREAIVAAQKRPQPIELLVRVDDEFRTLKIDYHDGLRYPHLQRVANSTDRLAALLRPRAPNRPPQGISTGTLTGTAPAPSPTASR